MFSLTPATRHASICRKSSAPAWSSCLKMTRLATCSPAAIWTGATAARIRCRPRTSSGLVGSSTQYG